LVVAKNSPDKRLSDGSMEAIILVPIFGTTASEVQHSIDVNKFWFKTELGGRNTVNWL